MNVPFLREDSLHRLKFDIGSNVKKYEEKRPWIQDYFREEEYFLESQISIETIELKKSENGKHYDLENAIRIFEAMRHLKKAQATDERLWTYLTHVTFWDYMRSRWPVEKAPDPEAFIQSRYFFKDSPAKAPLRNGIARLWWYGCITYDENRSNPYELTEILLETQDIATQLLERSFSRNSVVTNTILSVLLDMKYSKKPFPTRKKFRELLKNINRQSGVTVLDALSAEDIRAMVSGGLA